MIEYSYSSLVPVGAYVQFSAVISIRSGDVQKPIFY